MSWDTLTIEQTIAAKELARAYHSANPNTLPTYAWMKRYSQIAAELPHTTLIAFGRVVLDACKALQKRKAS